jgi:hypothetical protein
MLKVSKPFFAPRRTQVAVGCALMALAIGDASAMEIDTGNSDVTVDWTTTARYTLGVRAQNCDPNICGSSTVPGDFLRSESDSEFSKAGDVIMDRLDLLSGVDATYKGNIGFRVSGDAWYDNAASGIKDNSEYAAFANDAGANGTNSFTDYTKRWNEGPSGQILDAFVFGKADLGGVPVDVKAGQHNVFWGESFFSFVNGVAYDQGPVDLRKALANPGSEAQELFLPRDQISFNAGLSDTVSLAGQYFLDWKPTQLPDGGTYFGLVDGASLGGGGVVTVAPGVNIPFGGITGKPANQQGDWGLALKTNPEWLDGRMGFYFRRYSETFPQLVTSANIGPAPSQFGLDYSTPRADLLGISLSKAVGNVSVGSDLTYRRNAMLMGGPLSTPADQVNMGHGPVGNSLLPTGDITAGVVNAFAALDRSAFFDTATVITELSFTHVNKVLTNPQNYLGQGYGGCTITSGFPYGCATSTSYGISALFDPKWYQVRNGLDVDMPLFVSYGIHGNSALPLGEAQGMGSYKVGVTANFLNQYTASLQYNGFIVKHADDELGPASLVNSGIGAKWWDRNFISLTLNTSF